MNRQQVSICIIDDQYDFASYTKDLILNNYQDVVVDIYNEHTYDLSNSYDIYILDIELGQKSGFDIAEVLQRNKQGSIIFLTSHEELARKGYRYQAAGFVSKLSIEDELLFVLDRLLLKLQNEHILTVASYRRSGEVVSLTDIVYAQAAGHYCDVYTREGSCKVRISLSQLCTKDERMFCPCKRGIVVNVAYITSIMDDIVYLEGGIQLPISRRNEKSLKDAYKRYCLHAV